MFRRGSQSFHQRPARVLSHKNIMNMTKCPERISLRKRKVPQDQIKYIGKVSLNPLLALQERVFPTPLNTSLSSSNRSLLSPLSYSLTHHALAPLPSSHRS